ncbi:ABC transporter substrate-binding protein [Acidipropionibacterium jensenii]|uniref:ABC transporter substrate-binding protein n=1 Tax=Acidipropionibacterium jensenii TaxID=1749 RepID=UPI000BC33FC4|nr:ABC transporter substrate-binding protein [Acidipropionibacterium jensenii]AZZ42970.1 ABC transporter substrate-binding protein [Acidipropionibacterium jensenii]
MNRFGKALTVGIAATVALAMTGCGPDTSGSAGSSPSSTTDFSGVQPAKEISFWGNHPGNSIAFETEMAKKFQKKTGIKVNIVSAGSNYDEVAQKFQTAQVGGGAGDLVVVSDATWFSAHLNGSIAPVDEVFKAAKLDTGSYYKSLYDDYSYEGAHYAVPYARSLLVYIYDKDAFKKAGLPDKAPATWDQVEQYSKKLKAANPKQIPFTWASDTSYVSWGVTSLLWANGGDWSNKWDFSPMTSDKTISSLTFAQDSVKQGWAQVLNGDPSTVFGSGAIAQMINSSGGISGIKGAAKFNVGVGVLPTGLTGDTKIVPSGGAGLAINAKTTPAKKLAAAMFADYLTSSADTVDFSKITGYVPVRTDADTASLTAANPDFQAVLDSLKRLRPQSYARVLVPGGASTLDSSLMKILVDKADVKQTMTAAQTTIKGDYEQNVKK